MSNPESGNSAQLLKYGSEQIRDYVDDNGDVRSLGDLPNSEVDQAFTEFEWADGPVPDVPQVPVVIEEPFSTPANHKASTRKAAMRQQYADGPMIETENGLPHYYDKGPGPTPEQQERNHRFTMNLSKMRDAFTLLRQIETDIAAANGSGDANTVTVLSEQRTAVKEQLRALGANPDLPREDD